MSGAVSYHAGRCAEDQVAAEYVRRGHLIVARRWRGQSGEIDLVTRKGDTLVFVEVKSARSHDRAAGRISARQMRRICAAAEEYCAGEPHGLSTDMRFDAALLDRTGVIRIEEIALH